MAIMHDSIRAGGLIQGPLTLRPRTVGEIALDIQGIAGQTARLQRWRDSAGTEVAYIDNSGNLYLAGTATVVVNEAITGNINLTGTLAVTGATTLSSTLSVTGNLITSAALTIGTNATFGGITSAPAMHLRVRTATPAAVGNNGILYTQAVTNITELFYADSVGNTVQITSAGVVPAVSFVGDDLYVGFGNVAATPDVRLGWNTTQTVDGLFLGLSDAQNTFIIAENGDRAYDFAHGAQTNPTVFIHSAAQNTAQWLSLAHNQTDAVIANGAGDILFTAVGGNVAPSTNDGAALGRVTTGEWSDLYLAAGGIINWNNGGITITEVGDALAFASASGGYTFDAKVTAASTAAGTEALTLTNTTDNASVLIAVLEGNRATITDGDEAYVSFKLSDSVGNQDEGARITWKATTVASGATQDTDLILAALVNNVLTTMLTLDGSANEIVPAVAINSAAAITGTTITATSFVIGANTLTTSEWAFLDGQNQSVFTTSSPTFVNLTITSFAANWTNAGRTVADLGVVTTVDINGGTLDGVTVGGAVAAAGTFTTIAGSTAGNVLTLTNSTDAASVQVGILQGDRATVADGDAAYLTFRLSDSAGTQDEQARITWQATTVLSGVTQDGDLIFSALVNEALTTMLTLDGSANEIVPAVAINSAAAITGTAITGTSFVIGANTLTTAEWANLDGVNQTLATTSSPTFVNLTITSFAANWTNAGRTVADLGIVTTVDINGGTLDGTTIGGAASAAGTFTTITGSTAGNVLTLTNSTDAASVQVGIIQGDRATVADGDEAYLTFRLSDSGGTQDEGARITWKATTVLAGATQDTDLIFSVLVNNSLTQLMTLNGDSETVIIGGTTSTAYAANSERLEINTSAAYGGTSLNTWSATAAEGSILNFRRSKSATIGTHTALALDDALGYITFRGSDGVEFINAASIQAHVDGAVTGGGTDDMPGRLSFWTSPDGSATLAQRMTILNSGVVTIGGTTNTAYGSFNENLESNTVTAGEYGGISLQNWNTTGGITSGLTIRHSKSGTVGTHTALALHDGLGQIIFQGSDGTAFRTSVQFLMQVDGAVGASQVPGRLILQTADSAGAMTDALWIDSSQNIYAGKRLFLGFTSSGVYTNTGRLDIAAPDNAATAISLRINATQANVTAADTYMTFESTGGVEGSIQGTATGGLIAYNTFHACHWSQSDTIEKKKGIRISQTTGKECDIYETTLEPGTALISLEEMSHWDGEVANHLPKCEVSTKAEDKRVYGVYQGHDRDGDILVSSIGAGVALVNTEGGDIEIGDFLCTSNTPGICMKYNGNDMRVVLGKARKSFSGSGNKLIPCSLYSG